MSNQEPGWKYWYTQFGQQSEEETMDVGGSYSFDAPPDRVWELLLDPDNLARCTPGCEKLEPLGNDQYEATLRLGVGSIMGSYRAKIKIEDKVPVRSYKLVVEGKGSPGFVRGEALITLEAQEGTTMVIVEGQAQVGGTIAMVGQRLIGSVSKTMMDRFFSCLQNAAS